MGPRPRQHAAREEVKHDENFDSPTAFQRWYGEGATAEDACYAALLEYIKGVRE